MPDWRVLIVEDDAVVASVHRRLVEQAPGFRVCAIADSAERAARLIEQQRPELLLLDLGLPGRSGVALLRELRARDVPIEAIAITASRGAGVVRSAVQLGVVDYLVKPFAPERLREALARFAERGRVATRRDLDQATIDRLSGAGVRGPRRGLPRDLAEGRLGQVRTILLGAAGPLTARAMADTAGVSRVTARRYLEYLVTRREATVAASLGAPGRPTKLYSARGLDRRSAPAGGRPDVQRTATGPGGAPAVPVNGNGGAERNIS